MQKVKIFKKVNDQFEPVLDCAAQFNPEKLKLSKKASWKTEKTWQKNIGNTTFTGGDPIKLSAELFFDTTDSTDGDVRGFTEPLMALTLVNLDNAAAVTSPETIKSQLEAKKKEQDATRKSIEDMEKNGQKERDAENRRKNEDKLSNARTRIENLQQELRDIDRTKNETQEQQNHVLFAHIQLESLNRREREAKIALEQAKEEERQAQDYLSRKGPYEQASEDMKRLDSQVEELTNQSKGLTVGSKSAPPVCKFVWGSFSFVAIMESVKVTYTMFRPNGTPIRAKAKIKMKQVEEESFYPPQNPTSRSAPRKVWVVQEGQRLDWIAHQEYGNPAMWRYLAEINRLDNPMKLRAGQILNLI